MEILNQLKKLEYVVPIKCYNKNNPFLYVLCFFCKDSWQSNHWVGNSMTKPVDDVAFQKRWSTREVNNDEQKNLEMETLDEGAIDKTMTFPEYT